MINAWHVDDDQEMIQAIAMLLSLMDIKVQPFHSARPVAQALMDGERPDLLILDINMPEVTGVDLLEFIRGKSAYDNLPIVMLSSEDTDVQVHEALDKGADAYVLKPVTIEELELAIKSAVAKRIS